KKYNLALLSNTNDLHFKYLYDIYKDFFDNNFKKLFLSYEMKQRKPEKEIYLSVIDFYKTGPQNIFFTDDNKKNIDVAKKLGIKAYDFETVTKLKDDLKSFGIEI
ncbi:MAG: HAD hydrolase-like protein, partial [Endomicrobiaceae bacterium]|nr:HAD hydrolase-like protein [Endomicrobiaceae bacterium]